MQRFVQQLDAEVSGPPLELPSYPVAALRAQRILMDPHAGTEKVLATIGGEPVLAAKIIMMANAAALNRSGKPVADLRTSISRLGFDALRTAAISFAIAQLRNAPAYRTIAEPMKQLWQRSVEIAAISYVVARQCGPATPDSAMLAGLVSGMGKLYLLTRTTQYPTLFADAWTRQEMFQNWHAQVARSILQNWHLPAEVVEAVGEIERAATDHRTRVNLADVLASSQTILELQEFPEQLGAALGGSLAAQRLGLSFESCEKLLADSADERAQLRRALAV
jgi:HD-like signal output (HDOD) protein